MTRLTPPSGLSLKWSPCHQSCQRLHYKSTSSWPQPSVLVSDVTAVLTFPSHQSFQRLALPRSKGTLGWPHHPVCLWNGHHVINLARDSIPSALHIDPYHLVCIWSHDIPTPSIMLHTSHLWGTTWVHDAHSIYRMTGMDRLYESQFSSDWPQFAVGHR